MKRIFTLKFYAFLCLVLLGSVTANSQCTGTTACDAIPDENFAGGRGTFTLGDDFGTNSGALRSVPKGAQVKGLDTLHSGTYTAGATGTTLTYGFTLGSVSTGTVSSYKILARYTNNPNDIIVLCSGTTLSAGALCFNYTLDPVLANIRFRFEFLFTLSGSNNGARITFDNFSTNATETAGEITLPVSFVSVVGKKVNNGTQLTWKVAGEQNVKQYDIERSSTGNGSFTKIGTVPSSGSDSYSFTDAASHSGTVFYRIKNIDNDGRFTYSTVLYFKNGAGSVVFRVVPTVVNSKATVEHSASTISAVITLSTANGQLVRSLHPATGSVKTDIDMSSLRAGLYLVKWSDGKGAVETAKVIKQ